MRQHIPIPQYGRWNRQLSQKHLTAVDLEMDDNVPLYFPRHSLPIKVILPTEGALSFEAYEADFLGNLTFTRARWVAKKAFLDTNPHVKLRRSHGSNCFHFLRTGVSNCFTRRECDNIPHEWCDHAEKWKTGRQVKELFLIGHPYHEPELSLPEDMASACLSKAHSWYYPGRTNLTVIGRPEIIATLTLDYDVPEYPMEHRE